MRLNAIQHSRRFWLGVTLIYMVALLAVSLKPIDRTGPSSAVQEATHNFFHVPAYALLTLFWVNTLTAYKIQSRILIWAFCISCLYGLMNELLQGWVPGRFPSRLDIFLNTLGTVGMLLFIKKRTLKRDMGG